MRIDPDRVVARLLAALAVVAAVLVLFTGCTRSQMAAFAVWHATNPTEAVAWLESEEGQATLDDTEPAHPVHVASSPKWDAVAMCESGGNWSYPPVTNRTGTYSGGLMIWQKAWVAYGGTQYAPWAYQASKAEQIVVAERILADRGWGAWDCA
jgi:hypothetical protein